MGKLRYLRRDAQDRIIIKLRHPYTNHALTYLCTVSIMHVQRRDRKLDGQKDTGPSPNAKGFYDWLSYLCCQIAPEPHEVQDPHRDFLPDGSSIVPTHGDLHRSNIIVSITLSVGPVAIMG